MYQELGSDNVEPLPFKVLVEHPLIQDVMAACQTYKALVSTNTNSNFITTLLHCPTKYKVILYQFAYKNEF